jgi:hypothetical protein
VSGYTQDQVNELRAAIARGALRVSYSNGSTRQEVQYDSLSAMRATLAEMERQIAAATGRPRARFSFTRFAR